MSAYVRPLDFAQRIGVSRKTVYRWIYSRTIPYLKIRGVYLIDPVTAQAALERFRKEPVAIGKLGKK